MARTKQTARRPTQGGKAPRKQLAAIAARKRILRRTAPTSRCLRPRWRIARQSCKKADADIQETILSCIKKTEAHNFKQMVKNSTRAGFRLAFNTESESVHMNPSREGRGGSAGRSCLPISAACLPQR
ncbi:histone H3/CENP-A [Carpediemonas membranifera]|uniref:Histone H3/CENP-A n=1 Tax=Carpediemonas membranifera TaxID=201153 RepID=A0A8J6B473_9EUKA|nr:histone H3/CENP-A [Carpediemonas membranifera]|eukprot:KAG9389682.1 histone H3/CENP-A [Carpediemonas membranifera]